MRACVITGTLGLILIPSFLISQEPPAAQDDLAVVTISFPDEFAQSTQQKKNARETGGSDELPRILWSKKPEYPPSALKEKAQGLVETKLFVDKQGSVYNVEITQSSGRQDLDDAAVNAARQYKFSPAKLNGVPVNSCAGVPFQFHIEPTASAPKSTMRGTVLPFIVVGRDDKGGEENIAPKAIAAADRGPSFSKIVRPRYPDVARARNISDNVTVAVTIDERGDVVAVSNQSKAANEFVQAALAASAKCRFVPAYKNGQPVESTALIRYQFDSNKSRNEETNFKGGRNPDSGKRDSLKTFSDTLILSAERSLADGNMKSAESSYEAAIKLNGDPRGYLGLCKIALIREDWASARNHVDKVLELGPGNIEARYYAAISYRESGRWRLKDGKTQSISVEHAFAGSTEHFQWILQRDSSCRDVLYQYSLLMRDQERFGDAMSGLCSQIRLKPGLAIAWTGMMRLVRAAVHDGRGTEILAHIEAPLEALKSYVRAEELRSKGSLDGSERILQELLETPSNVPSQLFSLSLIRIHAKKGQFQKLEDMYWKAVNEIKGESGAALLFDDIKHVLSPQEIFAFPALPIEQKRDQFFSSVWNRRNPTLASPSNPRLHEHYQRLAYAEENFYLDRERFSFNYERGRPGLDFEFTDKGRVYIRQGPPDEVFREGGSTTYEAWHYRSTDASPEMTFQYFGTEESFSPGSLGSAAPSLNSSQPYSPWPTRSFGYTNIPKAEAEKEVLHNPMENDIRVKRAEMSDLAFWDPNYFDLWRASLTGDPDVAIRAGNRIIEGRNRDFREALTTERYNSPNTAKVLHLPAAISAFRAGTGKSVLEVAYSIPAVSLLKESGDTLHTMEVETGFAVYDRHWRKIVSVAETLQVSLSDPASNSYYRLHQTQVKPDSYYVAVYAHPFAGNVIAKSEKKVVAPDFWNSGFSMSDPQLAFDIRKEDDFSIFDKEGLRVLVNPLGRQALNRPMYVYFELYNPTEISKQQTDMGLQLDIHPVDSKESIVSHAIGLLAGEKKGYFVTSEADHWKTNKALARYLVVDVTRMQPGRYVLNLTIEDKPSKKSVSRSLEFELVGK
jgi:TonB family protein